MPFCCRSCGSRVVYHTCRTVARETTPVVVAALVAPAVVPPIAPPASTVVAPLIRQHVAPQDVGPPPCVTSVGAPRCCEAPGCARPFEKRLKGLRFKGGQTVRVLGDAVCRVCYVAMRDEIEEHIPAPPRQPAGYVVARSRASTRVPVDAAITLAWCHGRLIRAYELKTTRMGRCKTVSVATL